VDKPVIQIDAIALVHRVDLSLSEPVHTHVCVVEGVSSIESRETIDRQEAVIGDGQQLAHSGL
jgi:hypothetical protein